MWLFAFKKELEEFESAKVGAIIGLQNMIFE